MLSCAEMDADTLDCLHPLREFSKIVVRPLVEIVDAIERGELQSICKGDRTVSMRMYLEWQARR